MQGALLRSLSTASDASKRLPDIRPENSCFRYSEVPRTRPGGTRFLSIAAVSEARECGVEVRDEVVGALDADRQPDQLLGDGQFSSPH